MSSVVAGVDTVTAVTEGIFSFCSFKVKVDTDRWLGPEQANVRVDGEVIGHVTTAEYGSQMLSLGGVHHITAGSKREGRVTVETLLKLGNREPVALEIEGGSRVEICAGRAPVIDGEHGSLMRVGCGSAVIGIFAKQFYGLADEVVVVDDHITGVLSGHQAGRCLDVKPTGIRIRGKKSTPGRYFQVANPGQGWGGTDLEDPLAIFDPWDSAQAWPGLRLLVVSTTGDRAEYYVLDDKLMPQREALPSAAAEIVGRIAQNCEPSIATVLFMAGAGGSLRAGITDNPVLLTRAIKEGRVTVRCGGAPVYVMPGGGITFMVDVERMPARSFGSVPTPAIVAPIEFSMTMADYLDFGGHSDQVFSVDAALSRARTALQAPPRGYEVRTIGE
ncbi:MAG: 6-hydroxynicotinate reductase [Proteobacteria bacterium]|nr:6-hydroxynicotinate reductase [Pseudomonadota bacterium]